MQLRGIRRGLSSESWEAKWSLALACLRVLAILASCGAAAETISPEDPLAQWTRRSPLPHGTEMIALTFGGGKFVAAGYGGVTMTSSNGADWTVQVQRARSHIYDLAYGNGRFIAVQAHPISGTNLISTDGLNWFEAAAPIRFEGIGYVNGRFVGGGWTGSEGRFYSSLDGVTWTAHGTVPGNVTQIIHFNGRYVASGYSGRFFSSTDLNEWTTADTGTGFGVYGMTQGNGTIVAVGQFEGVLVSTNGQDWARAGQELGLNFYGAAFAGGRFVIAGTASRAGVSEDGFHWSAETVPYIPNIAFFYNAVAAGNGQFVAVGSRGAVATCTNGHDWRLRSRGTIEQLYSVTSNGREWVAAGRLQEIVTSSNGVDWVIQRNQQPGTFTAIHHANGLIHASMGEFVLNSTDATNWIGALLPIETWERVSIRGYAYGAGRWVGVATGGNVFTSTDGKSWTRLASGLSKDLNEVVWARDRFVAVGTQGQVAWSANGLQWNAAASGTTTHLNGVTYGEGRFVAVGLNGLVLTSPDGIQWSAGSVGAPVALTDVSYGGGGFVAVGLRGVLATSADGLNWVPRDSTTMEDLYSVAHAGHGVVAVGMNGTIVQSGALLRLNPVSGPIPALDLFGPWGKSVVLEARDVVPTLDASTEALWQPVARVTLDAYPTHWRDTNALNGVGRLFRGIVERSP